jgi:hypothetical protein
MSDQQSYAIIWKQQVEIRAAQAGAQVRAVAHTVQTLADDFRKEPATALIADLTEQGADAIDRVGAYLEESEFETLLADAEEYTREHPLVAAAGGVAFGIVLSRLVKATAARRASESSAPRAKRTASAKPAKAQRPRAKRTSGAR